MTEYSPELNARKTAVSAFLTALVSSAKTAGLYKPGHPSILQIGGRVVTLLNRTLGQESTLTLALKAKSVLLEESELAETPETVGFASALHTLGVGQVLFTNRVSPEGMVEFFKVLTVKPDEKTSLTDLQKAVQNVKIDGLQMVFILSFVVTGEEEKSQTPGQLTEDQISAFVKAKTLPDFLALLLKQNEEVVGKQAEAISDLLDRLRYREIPVEKFEAEMDWDAYDPRIRKRFDEFRVGLAWSPKLPGARATRQGWRAPGLISWAGVMEEAELAALRDHRMHEKKESLAHALTLTRPWLERPPSASHSKYASFAYVRLLAEYGRDGDIAALLAEFPRWKGLSEETLGRIREKIFSRACAEQFVAHLAKVGEGGPQFEAVTAFALFFGEPVIPLLIEQMRGVQDKLHTQKLCALLTALGKRLGDAALVAGLAEEDWLVVHSLVGVLSDIGRAENTAAVARLLKHGHRKVRDAAVKFLAKFGGEEAMRALSAFVADGGHEDEVAKAVITLSQLTFPGIDRRLADAFAKTQSYHTKVAICRALSRFPTQISIALLTQAARRTWYEMLSGLNKELRQAARHSLEILRKEGKA